MLEYLIIPSDLVQVTTHLRTAGMPGQWGAVLFPDQCSLCQPGNVHGLFSLAVKAVQGKHCGQGREGQCSIFINLLYIIMFIGS